MYGQASPRWPTSTALVLMVAFFGVHLNSDLYLASPVTDKPGDFDKLAEMFTRSHDHYYSVGPKNEAAKCLDKHSKEVEDCWKKSVKEDFTEVTNETCRELFAYSKCEVSILCAACNTDDTERMLGAMELALHIIVGEECKEWESMAPKVPTSCPGGGSQRSAEGGSDKPPYVIYIIVAVVLVAAIIIAVVVYCLMCTGNSKGRSAKPGKSSKSSKSKKAGKSSKSGIKGGKSTKSGIKGGKSTKSAKSAKSRKSLKSVKSRKSSKGGKSRKSAK